MICDEQKEQFDGKQYSECQMKVIRCKTVLSCCRYEILPRQTVTAAAVLYLPNSQTPPFEYLNLPTVQLRW